MILRKKIIEGKEVYEPITFQEALNYENKDELIFTDEDEKDEFEDYLDEVEDKEENPSVNDIYIDFSKIRKGTKKLKDHILPLLPFMDADELRELVSEIVKGDKKYEHINFVTMMPFLDESDCDELFLKVADGMYPDQKYQLTSMAPFVSAHCLSKVVDKYIEGKYEDLNIDGLYPFMKSADIKRLFDFYLNKRNEKNA